MIILLIFIILIGFLLFLVSAGRAVLIFIIVTVFLLFLVSAGRFKTVRDHSAHIHHRLRNRATGSVVPRPRKVFQEFAAGVTRNSGFTVLADVRRALHRGNIR